MKTFVFPLIIVSVVALLFSCSQKKNSFTFGVMADCQYCDCNTAGSRFYRNSPQKISEAVNFFNGTNAEFVVHLGDLIDRDFESYDTILNIMDGLNKEIKYVLGNHEYAVAEEKKSQVPAKLGMEKPYYSFQVHGWRFIVTDGNDVATYSGKDSTVIKEALGMVEKLKEDGLNNAYTWNGGISSKQLSWIEDELKEAEKLEEQVIVFSHFPIAPAGAHNLLNYREVFKLVHASPAFAGWFNGHNHNGNYHQEDKNHYLTFKGMVEKEDSNAYAMVTLTGDSAVIDGYGREPDRVLMLK